MTTTPEIGRIRELEQRARRLDPEPEELDELFRKVETYARDFLDGIRSRATYEADDGGGRGLLDSPIGDAPITLDAALAMVNEQVDRAGINPTSDRHFGYIPGGGLVHSAFGDFMADISNRFAGAFFSSPGAVRMENLLLDWMAGMVGYPTGAAGNLTSGGSIANLIAIVTARDAHGLEAGDFERTVVYLSCQAHHSVGKALRIAGLGSSVKRHVPLDEHYRMRCDALEQCIREDRAAGLNPWLVVASAGTTDTGAVDPLQAIGDIADRHGLWFHVDGAYGAFFALCEEGAKRLRGMHASDSIIMDPHKGLFLPYGSGAVLVKDRQRLFDAHHYTASYLQDALHSDAELSPADLSPELTKHFRGMRLWLPLKLLGLAPFRACLAEKIELARYFYARLLETEGFQPGPFPDLSVVTYRYLPKRGDPDEFNRKLIAEVHKDGRVFVSSTILDGKFTLRLAVLVFRTHLDAIDLTLDVLKQKARLLEAG